MTFRHLVGDSVQNSVYSTHSKTYLKCAERTVMRIHVRIFVIVKIIGLLSVCCAFAIELGVSLEKKEATI